LRRGGARRNGKRVPTSARVNGRSRVMSAEMEMAPEEPRGDEPYWFEELRRDAAYEDWLKRCDPERGDDDATEHQEHGGREGVQKGPAGRARRGVQHGGRLRHTAERQVQTEASGLHSLGDPF